MQCIICNGVAEGHHVKTRGAGGGDQEWNIMPLCRIHHSEWHRKGWVRFIEKHPKAYLWLSDHNWEIMYGKLWHEHE